MEMIHYGIVLVLSFFVISTNSMSWMAKIHKKNFYLDGSLVEEVCDDIHPNCHFLVPMCDRHRIVRKQCKRSCNLCDRVASPPMLACQSSPFGCCWDNSTIAINGCPKCIDKFDDCRYFARECAAHPQIRQICPVTCGSCKPCEDSPHKVTECPIYKEHSFCEISPEIMAKICSKTCGFCK